MNDKKIPRRKFIDLGIRGYSAVHLAPFVPASFVALPVYNPSAVKTYHGVCYHDCPDSCSWDVTVEDGEVKEFGGNKENPFTNGKLCNKMETFPQDVTFNPDRILTPLKRTGEKGEGKFERISWEQAMREVAAKVKSSVAEHGGESVLPFGYMGTRESSSRTP